MENMNEDMKLWTGYMNGPYEWSMWSIELATCMKNELHSSHGSGRWSTVVKAFHSQSGNTHSEPIDFTVSSRISLEVIRVIYFAADECSADSRSPEEA